MNQFLEDMHLCLYSIIVCTETTPDDGYIEGHIYRLADIGVLRDTSGQQHHTNPSARFTTLPEAVQLTFDHQFAIDCSEDT